MTALFKDTAITDIDTRNKTRKELYQLYTRSIKKIFNQLEIEKTIVEKDAILLKPNLVNASPFPITTSVTLCEAIIDVLKSVTKASICIGEGCGDMSMETDEVYRILGYHEMCHRKKIPLVDLNHEPTRKIENKNCTVFPEMHLPEIAFTHYIISLPVLKAHSLAVITGTLKNMIGFAPPEHYSGKYGIWKKAVFHGNMQQAIMDLNAYILPDFTIMDASVGLSEYHLGGAECVPPVGKMIGGYNPYRIDQISAELLGLNWKKIPHVIDGSTT